MPASPIVEGPSVTPYLKYQTELAWRQDDQRRQKWLSIRTESDLLRVQHEMRDDLLKCSAAFLPTRLPFIPR